MGDGLPALASGEPVLARWFVIAMLVLGVAASVVTVLAFANFGRDRISPAERRPIGTMTVTHDRGQAVLNDPALAETLPLLDSDCPDGVMLYGDASGRATGSVAMNATCQLLRRLDLTEAQTGLSFFSGEGGIIRVGVFERTGVDSSLVFENGVPVLELNAKFQRETAVEAVPSVIHELTHLGTTGWPLTVVDIPEELVATSAQLLACDSIPWSKNEPRSCLDARELLEDDPVGLLLEAGYVDNSDDE